MHGRESSKCKQLCHGAGRKQVSQGTKPLQSRPKAAAGCKPARATQTSLPKTTFSGTAAKPRTAPSMPPAAPAYLVPTRQLAIAIAKRTLENSKRQRAGRGNRARDCQLPEGMFFHIVYPLQRRSTRPARSADIGLSFFSFSLSLSLSLSLFFFLSLSLSLCLCLSLSLLRSRSSNPPKPYLISLSTSFHACPLQFQSVNLCTLELRLCRCTVSARSLGFPFISPS